MNCMAMELRKYFLNKWVMKKSILLVFFILASFLSYAQKPVFTFSDVVSLGKVEKVQVINNKGKHVLSKAKASELLNKLRVMQYHCDNCIKPGMKAIILTINKKEYRLTTSTLGSLITMDRRLATKNINLLPKVGYDLIFAIINFNIDNY
jgi:hypothetical protein